MRHDKLKIFELRKQGKTYREISKEMDISLSTLSTWFKNEKWSQGIKKINKEIHIRNSLKHLKRINNERHILLEIKYKKLELEAEQEFKIHKDDPLFMAGLMLYAGEGDKSSRNLIRMSNSEFYLHLVFIRFSQKFLNIGRDKIKVWLLLYPDHNIQESENIWSKKLGIPRLNFNKSQVIMGKSKQRKLQCGVGNSIISSTGLKKKIMKWLELCKIYFS